MSWSALPMSVRLAVWFSAWTAGAESLDAARDAVVGDDAAHDVVGLPGVDGSLPLILALGTLARAGARSARPALPAPGDPVGLGGPATFNAEALEAEEAVLLDGAEHGLVPHRAGAGVVWRVLPASSRVPTVDPAEADTGLRRALLEASRTLVALDVARWRPDLADELRDLRSPLDLPLPLGTPARAARLASTAERCRRIVALAREDEGGSVTVWEAQQRRAALDPLDRAARRALVAACSPDGWPPA